jgi:hypothetical protein
VSSTGRRWNRCRTPGEMTRQGVVLVERDRRLLEVPDSRWRSSGRPSRRELAHRVDEPRLVTAWMPTAAAKPPRTAPSAPGRRRAAGAGFTARWPRRPAGDRPARPGSRCDKQERDDHPAPPGQQAEREPRARRRSSATGPPVTSSASSAAIPRHASGVLTRRPALR